MTDVPLTMTAPTRIAATFRGGSLHGRWSYLPAGAPEYKSPGWGERYLLDDTVWHSREDDVVSHQVYTLSPVLFRTREQAQNGGEPQAAPRRGDTAKGAR
jgi:hypothetical protein